MCLVLKLDNGKVVSIANGQNHRMTDGQNHRTTQYRISIWMCKTCSDLLADWVLEHFFEGMYIFISTNIKYVKKMFRFTGGLGTRARRVRGHNAGEGEAEEHHYRGERSLQGQLWRVPGVFQERQFRPQE